LTGANMDRLTALLNVIINLLLVIQMKIRYFHSDYQLKSIVSGYKSNKFN
jgi:hypothetical protein